MWLCTVMRAACRQAQSEATEGSFAGNLGQFIQEKKNTGEEGDGDKNSLFGSLRKTVGQQKVE